MSEIRVCKFKIEMLDECVDLYMKTYAQEPWNESLGFSVLEDTIFLGVEF